MAKAVDGVSYQILPGETLGVVGIKFRARASQALSIMGLIPSLPGKIEGGEIRFAGKNRR
ncbi:MAG: hypothetical protein R3E96_08665 [Planctomycetota bacterium]